MLPCRRLKVAGRTYVIRWFTKAEMKSITDRWGDCNFSENIIRIHPDSRKNPEILLNTVLHEVFHAIWDQMAIAEDSSEERDVTCLANAMAGILRDNPKFGAWCVAMAEVARKR